MAKHHFENSRLWKCKEFIKEKTTAELMKESLIEIAPHLKDRITIVNDKKSLLKEVGDFFQDKSKRDDEK